MHDGCIIPENEMLYGLYFNKPGHLSFMFMYYLLNLAQRWLSYYTHASSHNASHKQV
jgi:hypothetical protein